MWHVDGMNASVDAFDADVYDGLAMRDDSAERGLAPRERQPLRVPLARAPLAHSGPIVQKSLTSHKIFAFLLNSQTEGSTLPLLSVTHRENHLKSFKQRL